MRRLNLLIDETLFERLKELPGTVSENVRSALVRYIHWFAETENTKISASVSKKGSE